MKNLFPLFSALWNCSGDKVVEKDGWQTKTVELEESIGVGGHPQLIPAGLSEGRLSTLVKRITLKQKVCDGRRSACDILLDYRVDGDDGTAFAGRGVSVRSLSDKRVRWLLGPFIAHFEEQPRPRYLNMSAPYDVTRDWFRCEGHAAEYGLILDAVNLFGEDGVLDLMSWRQKLGGVLDGKDEGVLTLVRGFDRQIRQCDTVGRNVSGVDIFAQMALVGFVVSHSVRGADSLYVMFAPKEPLEGRRDSWRPRRLVPWPYGDVVLCPAKNVTRRKIEEFAMLAEVFVRLTCRLGENLVTGAKVEDVPDEMNVSYALALKASGNGGGYRAVIYKDDGDCVNGRKNLGPKVAAIRRFPCLVFAVAFRRRLVERFQEYVADPEAFVFPKDGDVLQVFRDMKSDADEVEPREKKNGAKEREEGKAVSRDVAEEPRQDEVLVDVSAPIPSSLRKVLARKKAEGRTHSEVVLAAVRAFYAKVKDMPYEEIRAAVEGLLGEEYKNVWNSVKTFNTTVCGMPDSLFQEIMDMALEAEVSFYRFWVAALLDADFDSL